MRVRMTPAVAVTAALIGGSVLTGAGPASAQEQSSPIPVVGDFAGDAREEVFMYFPGAETDWLVSLARSGDTVTTTRTPFTVNRNYQPVAGNFDGDPHDEIVWYGYGFDPDYLWNFTSATSATSTAITVNGLYNPVAGDFDGNGVDDIFWYGPGPSPDHLWSFAADGSHTSTPKTVSGYYAPVVGSYGTDATDAIFWYNFDPPGPDTLWDFRAGTTSYVVRPYTVTRYYQPLSLDVWNDGFGGGDIFWYGFGPDPDYLWDFADGRRVSSTRDPVNGFYWPIATGDFFGDGSDDVLWFSFELGFGANVWDHSVSGTTLVRDRFFLPSSAFFGAAAATSAAAQELGSASVASR